MQEKRRGKVTGNKKTVVMIVNVATFKRDTAKFGTSTDFQRVRGMLFGKNNFEISKSFEEKLSLQLTQFHCSSPGDNGIEFNQTEAPQPEIV